MSDAPPAAPALLLIAHGTRVPEGAHEMEQLLERLRERQRGPLAHGWLEDFAEPGTVEAAEALAAAGAGRVVVVPFLNFAAYHARSDVPTQVTQAQAAHPALRFTIARVLGQHPALLDLAEASDHPVAQRCCDQHAAILQADSIDHIEGGCLFAGSLQGVGFRSLTGRLERSRRPAGVNPWGGRNEIGFPGSYCITSRPRRP